MKILKSKKIWIAGILIAIVCISVATLFLIGLYKGQQLEQFRNEALEKLKRDIGQYDDQSIVLYQTSKAQAEELSELLGADLRITKDGRFAKLTLSEGTTIRDVYANDEMLEHIEKMSADYQVHVSELTEETEDEIGERLPTRPQYSVSDTDYELQTYLDYLNMKNVWERYTGNGVTVAVIDTGIDTDHPEFAGRISEYSYNATEDKIVKDWLTEDGEYDWSLVEDEVGHGTAVTGVIAASMNSGNVVGIAPNVNIIVIKAECNPDGTFKRTSDLVFGLYYAIERDVNVVNMSFGASGGNPFAEAIQLAVDSDIVCVASAGNEGTSTLHYPAADKNVIGVGALAEDSWELASYSNYGENTNLVAPGTTFTTLMNGGYGIMNGTSLASPVVTGAIALFMQNNPYIMVEDVTEALYASSLDLGELGRDWTYGFGALDLSAFLLEERGTLTFDMLTDELENTEALFIKGHTLQELPEPERLYAVFDGWYYDDTFTQEYVYYEDRFYDDITLYAKWVNEDDGIPYTYVELEDGTIEIRSYTGKRRYITIPEKIDGKVVSSIGEFAFAGQTRLREVGLPSGLKLIKRSAFKGCSNLIWVEIPENVVTIGEKAFAENTRLSTVAFLGNSKLQTIGDYAFSQCGKLETIELPASLENINASAFYGDLALHTIEVQAGNKHFSAPDGVLYDATQSTLVAYPASHGNSYDLHQNTRVIAELAFALARIDSIDLTAVEIIGDSAFIFSTLENLVIPDSVTSMEKSAFEQNLELSSVTIGSGLNQISNNAFQKCTSLDTIVIPKGIMAIRDGAFSNCGLTSLAFEGNSVLEAIGEGAFSNCFLSEIDIPASVTMISKNAFASNPLVSIEFAPNSKLHTIGVSAFEFCSFLNQITLPSGLEAIGDFAFASTALESIVVPASVTSLGNGAFAYCSNLPAIEIEEGNTVYHDLDGTVYTLDNLTICAYPAGNAQQSYTLQTATRTIAPYSFAGTVYLQHVVLPEGLGVLNEYAFVDCGAYSYTLPSTLTNIMGYAFYRNENLNSIVLPESLVQIAEFAFSKCHSLPSVNIPDNVLQIGRYSFAEDWNLRTINFNATSKFPRISFEAFAYSGITSFTIPANVSTMAQNAFYNCYNLTSVTFAENSKLESLSAYVFDGCDNLQNITFMPGSALTSIQAHGFEGMVKLRSLDLTNTKLTNIDNFAFRFCEGLKSLVLPETITNVGRYAFYACKSLSELSLPEPLEHIGSYAFLGTNDLDLYLASETMPAYLDENWDRGIRGYYTGVTEVKTAGDYKYATLTSGNIAIIEYLGTETTVDLTTVDFGAPITTIGGSAFKDSTVTSIVLPETLTTIQAEAFQYTALEQIDIPANVTFIGREAFAHTDIKALTFANYSKLTVIEQYAFEGTEKLTSVTLPKTLTTMGTGAFAQSGLSSVTFADGINLKEVPQNAFMGTKLTTVALPDCVEIVNHNAFRDILTLESVDFGNSTGIRLLSNVFYNTGLESLHIPANVTFIGEYCFVGLKNLKEITVDANNPNYISTDGLLLTRSGRKLIAVPAGRTGTLTVPLSVEEIGFGAFENTALDAVYFDDNANILTLGYRAFFGAKNITELHVPASVVSIDYYAFAYCEKLQTVTFAEDNKLKGIYEGAFCGDINLQNITIPDSIVEISDFAFYGCTKIDKLPLGENNAVKGIYDYAFAYTSIGGDFTTPETLVDIGAYAFLGTDITKLTIPETNKKDLIIGIGAFEDCNKLTEVTLPFIGASFEDDEISWFGYIFGAGAYSANQTYVPESLKTVTITDGITFVGIGGFSECTSLETINVPHSVSALWNDAFLNTTARYELTSAIELRFRIGIDIFNEVWAGHFGKGIQGKVVLSNRVTTIGKEAFKDCKMLEDVVILGAVTEIGDEAFCGCNKLKSISFGNFLLSIGKYSFAQCYSLTDVSLPDTVTSIGNCAFSQCTSLKNFEFSQNITIIGEAAFQKCTELEKIVIPDGISCISERAFSECSGLQSVIIGNDVTLIEKEAFSKCRSLTEITIPSSVQTIESKAFDKCFALNLVRNLSDITLSFDTKNGSVSAYATIIIDQNRNTIYKYDDKEYMLTDDDFLFSRDENGLTLCAYLGQENTIELPQMIDGKEYKLYCFQGGENIILPNGWTVISAEAFGNNKTIKNVFIPDSVTRIEESAFSGCSNLLNVDIPERVSYIGVRAFYECVRLESIKLPNDLTLIEDSAFYNCANLSSIEIPKKVTTIGYHAFYNCTSLVEIVIPEKVTAIFDSAFMDCDNLERMVFEAELPQIGNYVFPDNAIVEFVKNDLYTVLDGVIYDYNCTEVLHVLPIAKEITIPAGITVIEAYKFAGCTGLEVVSLPDSVVRIENGAFSDCSCLKNITIPEGVSFIGENAFYNCESLVEIIIPDNVECINRYAFAKCINLTSVQISKKASIIKEYAFWGCENLETVLVPDGVNEIETGAFSTCSKLSSVALPDSLRTIGSGAFEYCRSLESIVLPDKVETIGSGVFKDCRTLNSITIPANVSSIGSKVFENCFFNTLNFTDYESMCNLVCKGAFYVGYGHEYCICLNDQRVTVLDIPAVITEIRQDAFRGCVGLEHVIVPDTVSMIGAHAFNGCSGLKSITLPKAIASIENNVFDGCINLKEIVLPSSVKSIGQYAFNGCLSLEQMELPGGITTIGAGAFSGCRSLQRIDIPEGVASIEQSLFSYCSSLQTIILPDSVSRIGQSAFSNCISLDRIVIPKKVTELEMSVFYGCDDLKTVVLPDGLTTIGSQAFFGCDKMLTFTIPESVTTIGFSALYSTSLSLVYNNSSLVIDFDAVFGAGNKCECIVIDREGNVSSRHENNEYLLKDDFLFSYYEGEYTLHAYVGTQTEIVLPDYINGDTYSISYFRGGEEISLPESITFIDNNAFRQNNSIRTIILPNSVTGIGSYAFYSCTGLDYIYIPGSVVEIGANAFRGCVNLRDVAVFDGLQVIGLYAFEGCSSLSSFYIPNTVVSIESFAFRFCDSLINISIPPSVTTIGAQAFFESGLTNNEELYKSGILVIDGWLLSVKNEVAYLPNHDQINHVAFDVYKRCKCLKVEVSDGGLYPGENVETLILKDSSGFYKLGNIENNLKIKNFVVAASLSECDLSQHIYDFLYYDVKEKTIYVEKTKHETRWNDNFPGWNNGNRVYYADDWSWIHFYDENGNVLYSEPRLNSAIIRRPVYEPQSNEHFSSELIGWDLDRDGFADPIPATTSSDLHAVALIGHTTKEYTVTFIDSQTQEVYLQQKLPYGTVIALPSAPAKDGAIFEGWSGYSNGMTVTGDITFTAKWHEHAYTATVTEPTCTTEGYTTHTCSTCGDGYIDRVTPATGHEMGEWYTVTTPTCTTVGTDCRDCANCDYSETRTVDALGHSKTTIRVDPTCTEDGFIAIHCEICYKELSREVLPATGHDFVQGKCTVCGEINFIYGDANGDGVVNGKDTTRLLRYIAAFDPMTGTSSVSIAYGADVNGDGKINGKDVTRLIRYFAFFDPVIGTSSVTLGP